MTLSASGASINTCLSSILILIPIDLVSVVTLRLSVLLTCLSSIVWKMTSIPSAIETTTSITQENDSTPAVLRKEPVARRLANIPPTRDRRVIRATTMAAVIVTRFTFFMYYLLAHVSRVVSIAATKYTAIPRPIKNSPNELGGVDAI